MWQGLWSVLHQNGGGREMLNWITDRAVQGDRTSAMRTDSAGRGGNFTEVGVLAGTEIATPDGWRAAETIKAGDEVLTFDGGTQVVRAVTRRLHPAPRRSRVEPIIHVPAGTVGNRRDLALLPDQGVMVESDLAEAAWGDPFALVTARALLALEGVQAVLPEEPVVAVTLACEADEVLFANGQALVHCPARARLAPATLDEAVWGSGETRYRLLDEAEARLLTDDLERANRSGLDSVA